jgi:flagellar hook assembly protein FlgD
MNGRIVKNITEKFFSAGTSTVVWNGNDNQSNRVKPGTYVCRMVTGSFSGAIVIVVY